jgi:hypothetical protein
MGKAGDYATGWALGAFGVILGALIGAAFSFIFTLWYMDDGYTCSDPLGKQMDAVFSVVVYAIAFFAALFGAVIGVRCSNNLIGWLDSGRLHGFTHLQVHQ